MRVLTLREDGSRPFEQDSEVRIVKPGPATDEYQGAIDHQAPQGSLDEFIAADFIIGVSTKDNRVGLTVMSVEVEYLLGGFAEKDRDEISIPPSDRRSTSAGLDRVVIVRGRQLRAKGCEHTH